MLIKKYPHHIDATAEVPDAVQLYRKILAAQPDKSVTIVTVGFLTNLANLLDTKGDGYSSLTGVELIRKKVKHLVSMAGSYPRGREYNVLVDSAASEKVFMHWPTPVIYSGFEIGRQIITGRQLTADKNLQSPVKDVFALCMAFSEEDRNGRKSWDQTAVLTAVKGAAPYFGLQKGHIVLHGGYNEWKDDPAGSQAYLTMKVPAEEIRIQHVDGGTYQLIPVACHDGQRARFSFVGEGMQQRNGAYIIVVGTNVRVQYDGNRGMFSVSAALSEKPSMP